jgi:hypothetical protein
MSQGGVTAPERTIYNFSSASGLGDRPLLVGLVCAGGSGASKSLSSSFSSLFFNQK